MITVKGFGRTGKSFSSHTQFRDFVDNTIAIAWHLIPCVGFTSGLPEDKNPLAIRIDNDRERVAYAILVLVSKRTDLHSFNCRAKFIVHGGLVAGDVYGRSEKQAYSHIRAIEPSGLFFKEEHSVGNLEAITTLMNEQCKF